MASIKEGTLIGAPETPEIVAIMEIEIEQEMGREPARGSDQESGGLIQWRERERGRDAQGIGTACLI
jgi:hypothetical protein